MQNGLLPSLSALISPTGKIPRQSSYFAVEARAPSDRTAHHCESHAGENDHCVTYVVLIATTVTIHADATSPRQLPLFMRFGCGRSVSAMGNQMMMVAMGWQMYKLTGSAWDFGLVGLDQFLRALVVTLPAGHAADRGDRGHILALCNVAGSESLRSQTEATRPNFVVEIVARERQFLPYKIKPRRRALRVTG